MRLLALVTVLLTAPLHAADADFNGRWNLEVPADALGRAYWLEIRGAGAGHIQGKFVGAGGGQVDPIAKAWIEDDYLHFVVERKNRRTGKTDVTNSRARLVGDELEGATEKRQGEVGWRGRRAPYLVDSDDGSWKKSEPVVLFDGKNLDAWHVQGNDQTTWSLRDGLLTNSKGALLLVSNEAFFNFEIELEYRIPEGSNSGVALRGRYEIQILDDADQEPLKGGNGALYSRKPADINATKSANEWQTFRMRLVGRDLTVDLNGKRIHDKVEVEGLTAMANNWNEAVPGPITLQGDHGPVEFRRIVVTPLVR